MARALQYKIVEVSHVTDETLSRAINEAIATGGWVYEGMHFAMRESSKRPAMAFLTFTREGREEEEEGQSSETQ